MADIKFTIQQIERYNDRIKNCLEDPNCRLVLETYLKFVKKPMLLAALKLWEAANTIKEWNDSEMLNLIEDVDDFNECPLLSLNEFEQKLDHTKGECCRILETCLPAFIGYLNRHHKAGPC